MGGCRCSYKNCPSATKTTENIHFFHYPVKQAERCRKWIDNACKPHFFNLAEDQLRNKVVCQLHFESKCFTNMQRNRLLHDAVPTLDAGSVFMPPIAEQYQVEPFENIQVLPANSDGTLFTVDTNSMQIVQPGKVQSYIYKDGTLVPMKHRPVIDEEAIYPLDDSESLNYTTNGSEDGEVVFEERGHKNPFLYHDTNSQDEEDRFRNIKEESDESCSNINFQTAVNPVSKSLKQIPQNKVVKQIKQHSREIALLKRALKTQKPVIYTRMSRTAALNSLRGHIPATLFTVLNFNVNNEIKSCSSEDIEFFQTVYETSPEVFSLLREKYGWKLPDPEQLGEIQEN